MTSIFILCNFFFKFFTNTLRKQGIDYWGHPSKKYIFNGQHSIRHFKFFSPQITAINFSWQSLRVCYVSVFISHSWLICQCSFQERYVWLMYWILSIGSQHPFPLPFIYCSKPKNNLGQLHCKSGYVCSLISVNKMNSSKT